MNVPTYYKVYLTYLTHTHTHTHTKKNIVETHTCRLRHISHTIVVEIEKAGHVELVDFV